MDYQMPDPIDALLSCIPRCASLDEDDSSTRQRGVIESNRVKLVQYIHDITLLFPHMKEKMVFSVDDCDIIKNEVTTSGKMDKFLDILLTKGPRAIGIFHEALHTQYPHVFDYLSRLFTNAGVELPPDRRLRETEEEKPPAPIVRDPTPDIAPSEVYPFHHHGSKTVRRSLDILSKHCNTMQRERDDLHRALVKKEEEISNLLSSREYFQSNLLVVTQKYQQLLEELVNWKDFVSNQSDHSYQKMLREHQSIQTEYDDLEARYKLNVSELSAARDRIMQLLTQVERSENVVAILQEERDKLSDKVTKLEAKASAQLKDEGVGQHADIKSDDLLLALQAELKKVQRDSSCLQEQLSVVSLERKGALDERDALVSQLYKEKEETKRLEKELEALKTAVSDGTLLDVRDGDAQSLGNHCPATDTCDKATVTLTSEEAKGLTISLGFIVRSVSPMVFERVKVGDEIVQINSIKLSAVDAGAVEFAQRLIHSVSPTIILTLLHPSQPKHPDVTVPSPWNPRSPLYLGSRPALLTTASPSHPRHLTYSISTPLNHNERDSGPTSDVPSIVLGGEVTRALRSISYDNSTSFLPGLDWGEGDIPIRCNQGLLGSKSSWAFQSLEKEDTDVIEKEQHAVMTGEPQGRISPTLYNGNGHDSPRMMGRRKAFIRRDKARPQVRHSRSLETIFKMYDLQDFAPVSTPQEPVAKMHRSVVLTGGFFDSGHRVIGGRGNSVFIICESTKNTCPLKTGDQLIKIEARTVTGMTHATLLDTLKLHSMKREMTLLVTSNMEGYEKLLSKNVKDRFYVRASFTSQSYGPRLLCFQKGDVLLVTDTCPEGRPGYWYAMKVTSDGHSTEGGYVPIEPIQQDLQSEVCQKSQTSSTGTLNTRPVALKSRTTAQSFKYGAFKFYQPINLVKATAPRPVILLGALEMEIRRCLVDLGSSGNLKFSYCPKRTAMSPLSAMEMENKVEVMEGEGHVSYSTCEAVEELMNKGYHCILSVSPEQLARKQVNKLQPMVLLLECKAVKTIRSIMASANISLVRETMHLERVKELKTQYGSMFNGTIQLSPTMGMTLHSVCKAISTHQDDVMWEDCPYDPLM